MELNEIVGICDSILDRTVAHCKNLDKDSVAFVNNTGSDLSLTVDEDEYSELLNVYLVGSDTGVNVYVNYLLPSYFEKYALTGINDFEIS